ncbi:MAG TPA: guanine deaminase [Caulobacteraceae bacterium]|nr:guanine deaminase [Caulobacteraceae bacterium]
MQAFRAALFSPQADPAAAAEADAWVYHPDGLLLVDEGRIVACGAWDDLSAQLGDTPVQYFPGKMITPGFVDLHIHFPQTDAIAAHGEQLLDWLDRHVFPAEAAFADPAHAAEAARFFVAELLRNGTTTALVFGSSHKASVDALFAEAARRDMRLIAGKSLMDRHAPDSVRDDLDGSRRDMEALIGAWHGKGRLGYAVTPRFAISCSDAQLTMAGEVLREHQGLWMQTHLAENHAEITRTGELFPAARDYLDVYDRFGLLGPRSVFAHCIHMTDDAFGRMAQAGAAAAFCPTSNLFLGSGLFDLNKALSHRVKVGMGTDVGAGTSFSLLTTLGEAYKVGQLRHYALDPFQAFYLATLGGARALGLGDRIGSLEPGKEADFLVLDLAATPLLERRMATTDDLAERLFILTILGDDRVVQETYVAGTRQHTRGI